MIKQRDFIENQIIHFRSSNNKCLEEIDSCQCSLETKQKIAENKEKELHFLLEELKKMTDSFDFRKNTNKNVEIPKKKEIPKVNMRPFPASSFSFNLGINKSKERDRIVINKSLNAGDKSSRSNFSSNNGSMILDSNS